MFELKRAETGNNLSLSNQSIRLFALCLTGHRGFMAWGHRSDYKGFKGNPVFKGDLE